MSVLYYLFVYLSLRDVALATINMLKMGCYRSQSPVLPIALNGPGDGWGWGLELGLTRYGPGGGPVGPPPCGSSPMAGVAGSVATAHLCLYL